ncbi:MAG: hypothetical protein WA633_19450 [Stellaceae bacterium]
MFRFAMIVFSLAMVPLATGPVSAETFGDASVGFSADRVLVVNGQTYVGKIWHTPGAQRHEQALGAMKPVLVLHAGSAVGEIVLPQLHTVLELTLPKELSLLTDPDVLRKTAVQETINGIVTTRYVVGGDTSGNRATGSVWLSDDGIPIKGDAKLEAPDGKTSTLRWELRHVMIGKQDPALFEVPPGYTKLPPEAAGPLLGIHIARHQAP